VSKSWLASSGAGVENKVHYVRDVTQGGQESIRTTPLVQMFALWNFALNLYRESGFENMAQANQLYSFGLEKLKAVFKMTE